LRQRAEVSGEIYLVNRREVPANRGDEGEYIQNLGFPVPEYGNFDKVALPLPAGISSRNAELVGARS
jgi:hypothetical protein